MSSLFLVATPIGNLEDISARALRVLGEVDLIAAEDTRHTRKLLQRYEIERPLLAYHEHNKLARLDNILLTLANGGDVALVSDAGTPAISDPGYELVKTVIDAGFAVVPIPGPCAAIAGIIGSGLPTDRFFYLGFPPRRNAERRRWFEEVRNINATLVLYEAPHRLTATLSDAQAVLGDRQAAVARELTKIHEQFVRGSLAELARHFDDSAPRGEIVVLIAGAPERQRRQLTITETSVANEPDQPETIDQATVRTRLLELRDEGFSGTRAAKTVAREFNLDRQDVYRLWTELE